MSEAYDSIVIGAGLYGLYAALHLGRKGERVLVLECEREPFMRATTINQARVHMGYHYPRSLSTAVKSAGYFDRFMRDYSHCILTSFDQVYATSQSFSWTNAAQFRAFCRAAGIPCRDLNPDDFFVPGLCDGAFLTKEYTYDAQLLKHALLCDLKAHANVELRFSSPVRAIARDGAEFALSFGERGSARAPFVLNATYASTNQVSGMIGAEPFRIKYELCEIILCSVSERLKDVGITVMDGPFFSIMPFGKTGHHSLTSVAFTPHAACHEPLPRFACQAGRTSCGPDFLNHCDACPARPASAWPYMSHLARKYLRSELEFRYERSLFSMKPILKASEVDDSRPTVVRVQAESPTFVSVLSGKINTIYDLDEVLDR